VISAAIPAPQVPVVPLPLTSVVGVPRAPHRPPAWRHRRTPRSGLYEGRAAVELVVWMIAQVGNSDDIIDSRRTSSTGTQRSIYAATFEVVPGP
jgi:hypothetical protein